MSRLQTPDNLSLKHRCYLSLVRGLARLPLPLLQAVGGVLGRVVYRYGTSYRHHFDGNLVQAFGADAVKKIGPQAQAEAGKAMFELPWLWLHTRAEILQTIRSVEGWHHVAAARAAGKFLNSSLFGLSPNVLPKHHRADDCAQRPSNSSWPIRHD